MRHNQTALGYSYNSPPETWLPCEQGEPCAFLDKDSPWCNYHQIELWYLPECIKSKSRTKLSLCVGEEK